MIEENEDVIEDFDSDEALEESLNIAMLTGRSSRNYYYFSFITAKIYKPFQ